MMLVGVIPSSVHASGGSSTDFTVDYGSITTRIPSGTSTDFEVIGAFTQIEANGSSDDFQVVPLSVLPSSESSDDTGDTEDTSDTGGGSESGGRRGSGTAGGDSGGDAGDGSRGVGTLPAAPRRAAPPEEPTPTLPAQLIYPQREPETTFKRSMIFQLKIADGDENMITADSTPLLSMKLEPGSYTLTIVDEEGKEHVSMPITSNYQSIAIVKFAVELPLGRYEAILTDNEGEVRFREFFIVTDSNAIGRVQITSVADKIIWWTTDGSTLDLGTIEYAGPASMRGIASPHAFVYAYFIGRDGIRLIETRTNAWGRFSLRMLPGQQTVYLIQQSSEGILSPEVTMTYTLLDIPKGDVEPTKPIPIGLLVLACMIAILLLIRRKTQKRLK